MLNFRFWFAPFVGIFFLMPGAKALKFPTDSVKKIFAELETELRLKHPGFYRYHTRAEMDRYADSLKTSLPDSLNEPEIYRAFKPFFSYIGCLHTEFFLDETYQNALDKRANLFPFQVYFTGRQAYIIKNLSGDDVIHPGAELLRVNGKTVPELLDVLLPAIPSDGYNLTLKYRSLYHFFPTWYRNFLGESEGFRLRIRQDGKESDHEVNAKKYADLAESGFLRPIDYPAQLEFRIENGIGILAVHTFSRSDIRAGKQQFKPFVDEAFREMRSRSVKNLVLDLRYNTGGSDANAAYLARYFFDAPYRYWDRIEVTESVASEIKGIYRLFYRKPVHKDSLWLWQKGKTVPDFDFYETQHPVRHPYTGKVYVLINGFCLSSCSDFTAVLASAKRAVFVGEETGGGYEGNNSGMMPTVSLKPTRLGMTVPLQSYHNAVAPAPQAGHGTFPDYPVRETAEDLIGKQDKALALTFALIKKTTTEE